MPSLLPSLATSLRTRSLRPRSGPGPVLLRLVLLIAGASAALVLLGDVQPSPAWRAASGTSAESEVLSAVVWFSAGFFALVLMLLLVVHRRDRRARRSVKTP